MLITLYTDHEEAPACVTTFAHESGAELQSERSAPEVSSEGGFALVAFDQREDLKATVQALSKAQPNTLILALATHPLEDAGELFALGACEVVGIFAEPYTLCERMAVLLQRYGRPMPADCTPLSPQPPFEARLSHELHRKEELIEALVAHASDIIVLLNRAGKIVFVNPAVESVLSVPAEQFVGRSFYDFIQTKQQEDFTLLYQRIRLGPKRPLAIEFTLLDAQQNPHIFEAYITNQLHNPSVRGVIVNARDITEIVAHNERAERTTRRLIDQMSTSLSNILRKAERMSGGDANAPLLHEARIKLDEISSEALDVAKTCDLHDALERAAAYAHRVWKIHHHLGGSNHNGANHPQESNQQALPESAEQPDTALEPTTDPAPSERLPMPDSPESAVPAQASIQCERPQEPVMVHGDTHAVRDLLVAIFLELFSTAQTGQRVEVSLNAQGDSQVALTFTQVGAARGALQLALEAHVLAKMGGGLEQARNEQGGNTIRLTFLRAL